jgi:lipopolysaccharide transport protein LptA
MATLFPESWQRCAGLGRRLALGLAAAAALGWLTGAAGPPPGAEGKPHFASGSLPGGAGKPAIQWVARSSDLDYKTRVLHLHGNVKISQGEMSVAADEAVATATSEDSKSQHWEFTGHVQVRAETQGVLQADHASVEITNGELASAVVGGSPAQFEQTRVTSGRLVKGHAATISYDVAAAVVKLSGDAWLSDERSHDETNGPSITYNMRQRRIESDGGTGPGGRGDATVTPKAAPGKVAHDGTGTPGKP